MLRDGRYDALIVDAHADDDGMVHLDVTVTSGEHKGEVLQIKGRFPGKDELDLLAMPATLVISEGQPVLTLDP